MGPLAGSDENENPRDWVEAGAGGIETGKLKHNATWLSCSIFAESPSG